MILEYFTKGNFCVPENRSASALSVVIGTHLNISVLYLTSYSDPLREFAYLFAGF